MSTSLLILIISTIALVVLTGVFRVEDARGGALVLLGGVRRGFDRLIRAVSFKLATWHPYLGRGFLRLLFHYFAHTVLDRLLAAARWIETRLERLVRRNRQVAKKIDAEKRQTHLDMIAAHKAETALTERPKQKLRSHD